MPWQTTYPTVATVQAANFDTVCTWCEQLPKPQTDVEQAVMRRLLKRRDELGAELLRRDHPDIADRMNRVQDLLARLTGHRTFPKT